MPTNSILDVIVPSYKTSKFVDKYAELLYKKELNGKVRFLLIDDGSPDDTLAKITTLSKAFPDYFLSFTKTNGGHGSVINYGLEIVKSPYFKIMDGDDYLDKEELEKLVVFLEKNDFDVVITKFSKDYISNGKKELCQTWITSNREIKNINELPTFSISLASSTFKSSLFRDNELRMREKVFYEDLEYSFFPLAYISSIYCLDSVLYHYIQYDQQLPDHIQSVAMSSIAKHAFDHNKVINDILDFYSTLDDNKKISIKKHALDFISKQAIQNYTYLLLNNSKEAKDTLIKFDKKIKAFKEINKIIKKNKIVRLLRITHYFSYALLSSRYKKLNRISA